MAKKDKRIKLLRNLKNKGLAYTLNKCLKFASGEYIARHDIDDISVNTRLYEELSFLQNNKQFDFVGTNIKLFDKGGVYAERILPEQVTANDFLFNNPFVHGSLMFRKIVLLKVLGYRDTKLTYRNEDYDLLMRLYVAQSKGYNIQKYLYLFLEDLQAQKRRKYKYRINECYVRYYGFKKLNILWMNWFYVLKPLIVGLVPLKLLKFLQNKIVFKENKK